MKEGTITKALKYALHQLIWVYAKWLLLLAVIWYATTGFYKIEGDSVGVLTRFGKVVERRVQPGLHYKLPWPVDEIHRVKVKQVKTLEINDFGSLFTTAEGGRSYDFFNETSLEPHCITGDNNIVAITLVIKYTIGSPVQYLFRLKQPELLMERGAAHLIVQHLAGLRIDEVLTIAKKQLEFDIQQSLTEMLELHETGIQISFLEIKEIKPPRKVQEEFDKVINAEVEKKKVLNEAQGYQNRIVPAARTEANRMIQEARAYKREKILAAEGEAAQFLSKFQQYEQNPQAHQEKIYLEFIQQLLPTIGSVRVFTEGASGSSSTISLPEYE